MNIYIPSTVLATIFGIAAMIGTSCEETTEQISDDLRLIKATANGTDIRNEVASFNKESALSLTLVFSHSLDIASFESAFTITGDATYAFSYDETNSFVTIDVDGLSFETDYTIAIPAGTLGSAGRELLDPVTLTFTTNPYIQPTVTLSTESLNLLEGASTTIVATLNKEAIADVTVNLAVGGTAIIATDYTLPVTLTIPEGQLSTEVTLTVIADGELEAIETLEITIDAVENALQANNQVLNFSLKDDFSLILKGIMALRWTGEADPNSGKAIHLVARKDIEDLSQYGLGIANNGGGTDGVEFTFPAIQVAAGEDILVAREPASLETYFGSCYSTFEHVIASEEMAQNGDDAIELFLGENVIETFGDADVDGTDQAWEYTSSWAYKLGEEWTYGLVNCTEGSTTTDDSGCIYPLCDNDLILKGVMALLWNGSGTNGGKAVHLMANRAIPDLSIYGIGVANNGGGTDGIEYHLPALSLAEGEHILLAREQNTLAGYMEGCFSRFSHVIETAEMNQNGDDAIELFNGSDIMEVFGDANVDGSGERWDYTGSWAYKIGSTWTYGGVGCAATATTNANSSCTYSFCD